MVAGLCRLIIGQPCTRRKLAPFAFLHTRAPALPPASISWYTHKQNQIMIISGSFFNDYPLPLSSTSCKWLHSRCLGPQAREHIDWRWPLSCVHSVMMAFSAQLAVGRGSCPSPFTLSTPSTRVALPLHPLPSKTSEISVLSIAPLPFSLVRTYLRRGWWWIKKGWG